MRNKSYRYCILIIYLCRWFRRIGVRIFSVPNMSFMECVSCLFCGVYRRTSCETRSSSCRSWTIQISANCLRYTSPPRGETKELLVLLVFVLLVLLVVVVLVLVMLLVRLSFVPSHEGGPFQPAYDAITGQNPCTSSGCVYVTDALFSATPSHK